MTQVKDISDAEAIEACRAWQSNHDLPGPLDQLAQRYPHKVALRKLEQLADRGLIEYGTTIAYSWPVTPAK